MPHRLQIDFVSDVSCPWCAIGLAALEQALEGLHGEVDAALHFQPFELNPNLPPGGQDITEHLTQKYDSTPEEQAEARERIRRRGTEAGFEFHPEGRGRVYNTFNVHRLLHWAGAEHPDLQRDLKKALLVACHGQRQSMESHEVLLQAVRQAGLPEARAGAVLASDAFADAVRERQAFYAARGIRSVPAIVINDRHLISGGQPAAVFEKALREIAAAEAPPATGG